VPAISSCTTDSLRPPMSNTEVVIALTGEILTGRPLFTRKLTATVSHDE
jgi:hypothetical protein